MYTNKESDENHIRNKLGRIECCLKSVGLYGFRAMIRCTNNATLIFPERSHAFCMHTFSSDTNQTKIVQRSCSFIRCGELINE